MKSNLTGQAMGGFVWKFLEKFASQGMQLIIQIILARLLLPEEYGLVGLLTIFITISDTFILQGLTTALIQKKNPDEKDFSSVFFSNIAISLLLYAILFISAPLVAEFYKEEQLTGMMRVLSLNVIIGAFPAVHNAILSRALDFKKSFFRNIANVLTQGIVGIFLAYQGFGAWAMVYSKTAGVFVGAVVLCFTVKWHPRKIYSIKRVKSLFSFSSKVLGTNLLNTIFNNIHSLIIGRFYTTESLGYYQRGQQIPQAVMSSFDGSMTEVLYPVFSKVQSDFARLKKALRKSIKTSMYITLPILMGLLVTAKPLTLFLLTEKWLPSVPFMQLACIICMFWPLSHRTHALNAIGKSNVTLKISLISKGITLALIFACLPFGIYAIMLGSIGASIISFFITSFFISKYLQYSLKEICLDLLPIILLAGGMGTIVYCVNFLKLNSLLTLAIQIPLGITIYVVGSIIFKFESFHYILNMLKNLFHRSKGKSANKDSNDRSTAEMLEKFLRKVDNTFPVALSAKQNLHEYAQKLYDKATLCTECKAGEIISLVAGYTKNTIDNKAYIAVVATLPEEQGNGFASKLIQEFIDKSKEEGLYAIHLYSASQSAIELYQKLGFTEWEIEDEPRKDAIHLIYYFDMETELPHE